MKERCVKERGGSRRRRHGSVRGEGEWLACLVLMCVLVNGICAKALAGSVQGEA